MSVSKLEVLTSREQLKLARRPFIYVSGITPTDYGLIILTLMALSACGDACNAECEYRACLAAKRQMQDEGRSVGDSDRKSVV